MTRVVTRRAFCSVGLLTVCARNAAAIEPAASDDFALFRAYPALAGHLPRVSLLARATPIEPATELARELKLDNLWLKRDDLSHQEYGGGKPRKLELLLAEARARGAHTVLTSGAISSNQAVAVAVFGAKLGLRVVLQLLPGPASSTARQNLRAAALLGAELRLVPSERDAEARAQALAAEDPGVYVIPMGGSSPLGNTGFVSAAFELAEQVRAGELTEPAVVYVAMGTMGTAAGLAVGFEAAGLGTRVVAVRASNPGTSPDGALRRVAQETARFLHRFEPAFPLVKPGPERLTIAGGYLGRGYAVPTPAAARAAERLRSHHDVALDPIYGAKAFAALLGQAPTSGAAESLFWVTSSAVVPDGSELDWKTLPREFWGWVR